MFTTMDGGLGVVINVASGAGLDVTVDTATGVGVGTGSGWGVAGTLELFDGCSGQ
jgi:hypothetical protein